MDKKAVLRKAARARRRNITEDSRVFAAERLARSFADESVTLGRLACLAGYEELAHEPMCSPITAAFRRGFPEADILVPAPGPGRLTIAWACDGVELPAEALGEADLILVPALGVDRSGTRLGQGGGWYDRALLHARPGVRKLAVVYEEEVWAAGSLPAEPHDIVMDGALTPGGVLWFVG